jgi:uncharacterized surface protein with fasciclin (FAS1) repeats
MCKSLQFIFSLLAITVLLTNCRKKQWDEYYGRPDNLEPPIYQQLQARGNFTTLLACIDKAGYKNILGAAGYWTFFAPHDSAFQVYFKEKNISGIDQLDSNACRQIVTYCLVYNAYKSERMGDYQSNTGWVPNAAFKRRTAYYTGVYDGTDTAGHAIKIIASNRNNNGSTSFVDWDNNNKYIPCFTDNYMAAKVLSASEYNYFYPTTPYTGFNVADAVVTEKDIPAENGVIHVINRVVTALPSLDQYLAANPNYSEFKKLFDRYLVQYVLNATITQNYNNVHGGNAQVYTKAFSYSIGFSPNNENFLKQQENDGQSNSYTLFVPTNAALTDYINTVILEHYHKLDDVPISIINDLVNAHMWQTAVWPNKFKTTFNVLNEDARFDPSTNVIDKKILSNGIFYGTNKVQEANVFSSVYGKAYLDPQFSIMTGLLNQEIKFQISNINQKYTIFLVSNSVLNAAGYTTDPSADNNPAYQWRYTPPNGGNIITGSSALVRLLRLLYMHIIPGIDVTNVNGSGVVRSYGGEFVRYNNKQVFTAGNLDDGIMPKADSAKTAKNGTAHYLNRALTFSELPVAKHIEKLGAPANSPFNFFWQYLKNSSEYNTATSEITNLAAGTFYTVFIPDSNAIKAAVNEGWLPGTGVAPNKKPNFNPSTEAEKFQVKKFLYYHMLDKKAVATDGTEHAKNETVFKPTNGNKTEIWVDAQTNPNTILLKDMNDRTANLILPSSNYLSNRCVIHLIDNYLQYTE